MLETGVVSNFICTSTVINMTVTAGYSEGGGISVAMQGGWELGWDSKKYCEHEETLADHAPTGCRRRFSISR